MAREQQQRVEEIKAPRGAILDRYGQRLAMSLPAESVCVDPLRVPDLSVAADVLSKVLNLDSRRLAGEDENRRRRPPRLSLGEAQDHAARRPSGCAT